MQTFRNGYRGISLLLELNRDRLYSGLALLAAFTLSIWLASYMGGFPIVERI